MDQCNDKAGENEEEIDEHPAMADDEVAGERGRELHVAEKHEQRAYASQSLKIVMKGHGI